MSEKAKPSVRSARTNSRRSNDRRIPVDHIRSVCDDHGRLIGEIFLLATGQFRAAGRDDHQLGHYDTFADAERVILATAASPLRAERLHRAFRVMCEVLDRLDCATSVDSEHPLTRDDIASLRVDVGAAVKLIAPELQTRPNPRSRAAAGGASFLIPPHLRKYVGD